MRTNGEQLTVVTSATRMTAQRRNTVLAEVHRDDLPDVVRAQDLLHRLVRRCVSIVERHDSLLVVALLGVENRLTLRLIGGERLLGHHVEAAIESLDDVLVME